MDREVFLHHPINIAMPLFKVRRTAKPNVIPAGLTYGEMAVNIADRLLYVGGTAGESVLISGGSGGTETTWTRADATLATDIAGVPAGTTFASGTTAIEILEQILYPYQPVSFSSFSTGLNATYELGQTAGNGAGTVTWATGGPDENWVSGSLYIYYSGFASGNLVSGGSPTADTASVTYPAFRSTNIAANTLTLGISGQQDEGTNPVTRSQTRRWWSRLYWGKSTNPALTDPLVLLNGSSNLLESTGSGTAAAITTASGGYFYTFIHDDYDISKMTLAGFDVALQPGYTASVMNTHGFSTTYKVYRTTNQLNDALTIIVTYSY